MLLRDWPRSQCTEMKGLDMRRKRQWHLGMAAVAFAVLLIPAPVGLNAQQSTGAAVRIDNDDIGGVVTSANGPEAGVWVIAETTDLPTKFAKIVVTDDQGRYVMPDLPKASYSLWVRGYGLVDSPKVKAAPGKTINLKAVVARNEAAAAEYYPAIYWYSMLKIPDKSEFPGPGKRATACRRICKARASGCPASRLWAASRVTNWATSQRVPFLRSWAILTRLWKRGSGGFYPDKQVKSCSAT